jgi:DNA-binding beta-propeller fold protein YncE
MLSKSYWWKCALAASLASAAWGQTFGNVVSIGGQASDLALDEPRGVLYIANFTANRVEVMSLGSNTIQTSINVAAQPSALALSPDDRYLVVANFGNAAAPASSTNAITVIDLTTNGKQTFSLGSPPLGVAFGIDGLALVVTTTDFLLLDPASGTTTELDTIAGVVAKTLPQPAVNFPSNIVSASMGASGDGTKIYGYGSTLLFSYDVTSRTLHSGLYTSSPTLGPQAISVSQDGSFFTVGWALKDTHFYNISQFGNISGALNIGTSAIDSVNNIIYAQMPPPGTVPASPVMQIVDSDNLTVRNLINLPENFAGKSVLSSDQNRLYGISDSGVMVLPVGSLSSAHQLTATQQDMVFRGNFCDRNVATQTLTITDPGGGNTAFSISSDTTGLSVNPSSGVTPAIVTVSVDPNVFASQTGTVIAHLNLQSGQAVNVPSAVRVLINSHQPAQRGTFVDIPGTLVDILPDPSRSRFYILRQDKNQVLVFSSTNNTLITTLRTGNTPKGMAITFDGNYLLVGSDNSQYVNVFDLNALQPSQPIRMFNGDYVQSLAASSNAILAVTRNASGGNPTLHRLDLTSLSSTRLSSLGVLMASADGSVMLYDANSNTFTVARKDFTALSGSYAASNFNQYVVGNNLLDSSLVPAFKFETGTGNPSGFAFVDQGGFRTTAPAPSSTGAQSTAPGVIERLSLASPVRVWRLPLSKRPCSAAPPRPSPGLLRPSGTAARLSISPCPALQSWRPTTTHRSPRPRSPVL